MELNQGEGEIFISYSIHFERREQKSNRIIGCFHFLFWAFIYFPSFPQWVSINYISEPERKKKKRLSQVCH
jgi:hypothetical protein